MITLPPAVLLGPVSIVTLSVAFIVAAIVVLRLHAFFTLIIAAAFVSLMTAAGQTGDQRFVQAIESVMTEFGAAAGRIGFPIAAAAVIGMCLMESGAADKIMRRFIGVIGESHAAVALLACGFILSAPVFFDTVMMLMLPLARALSLRTGKNYLLYALVICAGSAIANGIVPPAPGPLFVAGILKLELGKVILAGIACGLLPACGAFFLARWFNARMPVPVRPTPGSTLESLAAVAARPESELPGFTASIAPVLMPILLISAAAFLPFIHSHVSPALARMLEFLGDRNVALLLGGLIALVVYVRQKKIGWRAAGKVLGTPLETAGVIILIISAGGAYGAMIKNAGVSDTVRTFAGHHALNYVLLAWVIAAVIRAAQGSATVATITAVSIMSSIAGTAGFGVHPLYILLAIGFGSKFLAWMNDSGFWVISRFGGLTQGELLRSWTILDSLVSILGLIEVLVLSSLMPHLPF
ncbi:MAG TPA: SLC13 family permease [Opitutaceae bacterium]|jgi:GntP family gluconate:H+ symporter|nr:SLC13 family permease [Opitutaceae bacterium]